jgi:hypothetical protein
LGGFVGYFVGACLQAISPSQAEHPSTTDSPNKKPPPYTLHMTISPNLNAAQTTAAIVLPV